MLVSHGQKGFSAFCFKCGTSEFQPHKDRNLTDLRAARAAREFVDTGRDSVRLPSDFTLNIPDDAFTWLAMGGVSPELARAYHIGYSPSMDRIILPVFWYGKLETVQCRAIREWQKPKYVNPAGTSRQAVFRSAPSQRLPSAVVRDSVCVLCEDILSGIRIGRFQDTFAVLGTSISTQALNYICGNYRTAYLWFDSDTAGQEARRRYGQVLTSLGLRVECIITDRDPKRLTNEEIRTQLDARHNSSTGVQNS